MQPSYEEKTEKFSMIRKKPHHVPPHLHNAIELVYVTKGELELGIGYELYHMEKGDFAVVFPDSTIIRYFPKEATKCISFMLPWNLVDRL